MPVGKLRSAFISYMAAFDLVALAQSGGRLCVTNNPGGADQAWWVRRQDADRLLETATRADGDVRVAAFELGLPLTDHDAAIKRVAHRLNRIDIGLDATQGRKLMRFFNREYRRRRQAAAAAGARFMSYPAAVAGLRRALVETVAKGGAVDGSLIERALSTVSVCARTRAQME